MSYKEKEIREKVLNVFLQESKRFLHQGVWSEQNFSSKISLDKDDVNRIRIDLKARDEKTFYSFDVSELFNMKEKDIKYFVEAFIPYSINKAIKEILIKGVDYI
jgi:hypothetical protein